MIKEKNDKYKNIGSLITRNYNEKLLILFLKY